MKDAVQECLDKLKELVDLLIGGQSRTGESYIFQLNKLIDDSFRQIKAVAQVSAGIARVTCSHVHFSVISHFLSFAPFCDSTFFCHLTAQCYMLFSVHTDLAFSCFFVIIFYTGVPKLPPKLYST
jgi:hypothetical protein